MSDKNAPLPKPGDPHYSEAQMRPGVVLSWTEAFHVVPEIAAAELERIVRELEETRQAHLLTRKEVLYAQNRARNADGYLIDALRNLGIGNFDQAAKDVARARERLFPETESAE